MPHNKNTYTILGEIVALISLDDIERRTNLIARVRDDLREVGCDKRDVERFTEGAQDMLTEVAKRLNERTAQG